MRYSGRFTKRSSFMCLCVFTCVLFSYRLMLVDDETNDVALREEQVNVSFISNDCPPCECTHRQDRPTAQTEQVDESGTNHADESGTNHADDAADRINAGVEAWVPRLDPHNYIYIINPIHKCFKQNWEGEDLLLVIFVNSAPGNSFKRNVIRNTFGRQSAWPFFVDHNQSMRIVFSLGAVDDDFLQTEIYDEAMIYDDIVQENFTDDYLNMTLKTIMGLKWTSTFCQRAKFVMKIDDDVLINTPALSEILRSSSQEGFGLGFVNKYPIVRRREGMWRKFYTPKHIWPDNKFPPFYTGTAYMFSSDVIADIYHMALQTPLFPWSDVFIGICCQKLHIDLKHNGSFISDPPGETDKPLPTTPEDIARYHKMITTFHIPSLHVPQLWEIWTSKTLM